MTPKKEIKKPAKARRLSIRRAFSFVGNIEHPASARFGSALKKYRQSKGITQTELAKVSGLSRSYISEVEGGHASISLDRAERLAKALGSNLADLL
jgi:predicted transcriptional regulator